MRNCTHYPPTSFLYAFYYLLPILKFIKCTLNLNQTGYIFQGAAKNKQIIPFEGLYPQHLLRASMIHIFLISLFKESIKCTLRF